jgi:hypothetical protein
MRSEGLAVQATAFVAAMACLRSGLLMVMEEASSGEGDDPEADDE